MLNALFLSFVNLLSFHYKRHNQNKKDSTVNKNRAFFKICLFKVGFVSKERLMLQWYRVCLFSFLVAIPNCHRAMSYGMIWR